MQQLFCEALNPRFLFIINVIYGSRSPLNKKKKLKEFICNYKKYIYYIPTIIGSIYLYLQRITYFIYL